jgi:hypothetical protein
VNREIQAKATIHKIYGFSIYRCVPLWQGVAVSCVKEIFWVLPMLSGYARFLCVPNRMYHKIVLNCVCMYNKIIYARNILRER